MKYCFILLVWVSALTADGTEVQRTWHVAPPPRGNDANDGAADAPFASLDRARLVVRNYLATHPLTGDLVVEFRGGVYELTAPCRFDAADSGTNGFDVIYRSASGERAILSGGRSIGSWAEEGGGVYRASVGREVDFRQLWIDGRCAVRARSPNVGQTFTFTAEKWADGFDLPRDEFASLHLRPAEMEISVLIAWMHKRLRIARLADAEDPKIVRAVIAEPEWDAVTRQPQGDRVYLGRHYWLENAREFLDAPGEFFLDRTEGMLRYRPRTGEKLNAARVIRPQLENLIVLEGKPDAPVHHLRFEGLTLTYTGWTRPNRAGFVDVQANSLVPASPAEAADLQYRHQQRKDRIPAAFQANTADHITVRNCRFARLGGTGIIFTHGGNDNAIEQNSFTDLAAGGIEIGEDAARPANPRLIPRRNRIANNFITRIGEDYFGSVAILGYYTGESLITHNEIVDIPYTAISQGWGWGNPPAPEGSRANRITYNRVSYFLRRLDDGGGIYTTDRQLDSEIAFNVIERLTPPDPQRQVGGAIYLDQFTEGFHVHHNVITESPRWLYLWNPNIRGNRIEENYADTSAQRNDAPDNVVEAVRVLQKENWPREAREIAEQAGLESLAIAAGVRDVDER